MTKTAYEIRFDLLAIAKDMLDKQYDQACNIAWQTLERASENNRELYKEYEKYIPKMYTPEAIISQAEKLQTFINTK